MYVFLGGRMYKKKKKGVGCTKKGGRMYELGGRMYKARGSDVRARGSDVRSLGVGCTWITLCFNSFFTGLFTLSLTLLKEGERH